MTNFLLRLYTSRLKPDTPAYRSAVGRLSGAVGIACNVLLFILKLTVGTIAGAVSITADAMNNLTDAASSVVTLIGFRLALQPADEDHPYGHARYEYLSALAVAGMILVIGFELAKSSVEKILNPDPVAMTLPLGLVLIGTIAVKLWLSLFNHTLDKRIGSGALEATAADSRNDCIATGAVLIAAAIEGLLDIRVDGFMGLGVALFILLSGINLARETISPLLGEQADPQLRQDIVATVTGHPMVLGYHDLMVHDYGPGQRFASLHVEMDHREDPLVCHDIIDNLERQCMEKHNVHLVIHYDPVITGDAALDAQRQRVLELLQAQDSRITIHDFRMVRGVSHTNLIFDAAIPQALWPERKAIAQALEEDLTADGQKFYCVITFDMDVFN